MEVMDHMEPEVFPILIFESWYFNHLDVHASAEIKMLTYINIATYISVFRIKT